MLKSWAVRDFSDWDVVAKFLDEALPQQFNLRLSGNMGVGKTHLTKKFIELRVPSALVQSPTYNLVHHYGKIDHFDFYRLKKVEELWEIGFFESVSRIIEWPKFEQAWGFASSLVSIRITEAGERLVEFSA